MPWPSEYYIDDFYTPCLPTEIPLAGSLKTRNKLPTSPLAPTLPTLLLGLGDSLTPLALKLTHSDTPTSASSVRCMVRSPPIAYTNERIA